MSARRIKPTWWRRERKALVLLPLVVVGAMAASSSRVHDYWWQKGFHEKTSVSDDGVVSVSERYDDGFLTYPIRADLSLVSARPITALPDAYRPLRVPTGSRLWQITIAWKADPDVNLTGCSVALVDADGNRYDADNKDFDGGAVLSTQPCVPDETPGPRAEPGRTTLVQPDPGVAPRPESWETSAYAVIPEDVEPTAARVWWVLPDYAELPLD